MMDLYTKNEKSLTKFTRRPQKMHVYKMPVDRRLRVVQMDMPPKLSQSKSCQASSRDQQGDAAMCIKRQRDGTASYRTHTTWSQVYYESGFPDTGVLVSDRRMKQYDMQTQYAPHQIHLYIDSFSTKTT